MFSIFEQAWFRNVPLGVWEGLRLLTVALPGLFSYLFQIRWTWMKSRTSLKPGQFRSFVFELRPLDC